MSIDAGTMLNSKQQTFPIPLIKSEYAQDLSRNDLISCYSKDYFSRRPLTCEYVKNGIVLPPKYISLPNAPFEGGVLDSRRRYVDISAQRADFSFYSPQKGSPFFRVVGAYLFKDYEMERVEEKVIYMNCVHNPHWGHMLIDAIGRLWYALQNKDYRIIYTLSPWANGCLPEHNIELLELAGISRDRLVLVDKITQFQEIIVPESSIFPGRYFTKEYREIFDKIIENSGAKSSTGKKIYCSRSRIFSAGKAKEDGEYYIEKIFTDNGYTPVYMEQMTVREQIQTLNSAGELAMLNGTLAHNTLFIRSDNVKVTIINKSSVMNLHQPLVSQAAHPKICYVDSYVAPLPVDYGSGPFIIRITKEFIRFCRDNGMRIDKTLLKEGSVKLSFRAKVLYYWKWLRNYCVNRATISRIIKGKWRILKFEREDMMGLCRHYRKVRQYYRSQQKNVGM